MLEERTSASESEEDDIGKFLKGHSQWVLVPVSARDDVIRVPINRLTVKFRPEVSEAKAKGLLTDKHLRILEEPLEALAGRYIVVFDDVATKGPQLADELTSRDDLVEYVVPQSISVDGPRPFY